jgi:SOS response regulatory protein OraA/RecX
MDAKRAWNYTLWLLGRRAHTEGELRERLQRKEAEPDVITHTITRLKELGLIDDAAFTAGFIRSRSSRHGRLRLQQDLRRRGVAAEVISRGVEQLDDAGQAAAALEILRKYAWRFEKDVDAHRKRARAFAFLARRGFTVDAARQAVEDFLAEEARDT